MALEIIPLEIFGKIINHLIEDEQDVYVFKFYNKDGINITPATSIYTDEEEQIDELSTQVYYGVYIHPISQDGKLIFKFEYLNNIYIGVVDESDTKALNGIVNISFVNQTVEDRLLPIPTENDIGKVPVVQSDLTYGLEEGGGAFIISLISDVIDKTNGEVIEAINANKLILLYDGTNIYTYDSISYSNHYYLIEFTRGIPSSSVLNYIRHRIDVNDENLDEHPTHLSSSIPTNNVLANQTVPSGTTPTALDNLKIGADYFSLPHLYWHSVNIKQYIDANNNMDVFVVILNTSSTAVTLDDIKDILNDGGKIIIMCGYITNGGIARNGLYFVKYDATSCYVYQQAGSGTIAVTIAYSSISDVIDAVHQIF